MSAYRVYLVFNFNGTPQAGFSESYDIDQPNDDAAQVVANQIRDNRANFLSQDWFIVAVRLAKLSATLVGSKCKIKATRTLLCPQASTIHGALGSADIPAAAVFVDFFYQFVNRPSHRQFRGIPDDWWDNAALSGAKAAILSFCNRLKQLGHVRYVATPSACTLSPFALKCCDTRRISSRRVGRPFALLRGRRSKR